MLSDFISNQNK